jgi:hypothetical protein
LDGFPVPTHPGEGPVRDVPGTTAWSPVSLPGTIQDITASAATTRRRQPPGWSRRPVCLVTWTTRALYPWAFAAQRAEEAIALAPHHDQWRTRGRQLSQDEVFAVAIAALEDHAQ